MFATGIENSYPTIRGGRVRVDEMAACQHYDRWRDDFDLVGELGVNFLRYGPPLHRTWAGPLRLGLCRRDVR
jgi:beta-glucosidase